MWQHFPSLGEKIFDHNLVAMQFMLHKKHYDFLHEGNINHDHRQ